MPLTSITSSVAVEFWCFFLRVFPLNERQQSRMSKFNEGLDIFGVSHPPVFLFPLPLSLSLTYTHTHTHTHTHTQAGLIKEALHPD